MSEYIVSVPDEAAENFIAKFGLDGTKMMGYDLTGEVVRCRDCENYEPMDGTMYNCRFEINGFIQWRNAEPNGFCAWPQRKDKSE